MLADVSCGLEPVPIPLESSKHPDFVYIATTELPGGVNPIAPDAQGCDCVACDNQCPCESDFLLVECSAACACPSTCSNKTTQAGVALSLVVRDSPAGLGLFAAQDIPQGQFVCLYAGEIISRAEARRRWAERRGEGNYALAIRETSGQTTLTTIIDPTVRGNVARFVNHSCSPNLAIMPVRPVGSIVPLAAMFANREIRDGEELTFDYADGASQSVGDTGALTRCLCGSGQCRGFLPYDASL